ncbi:MAG: TraR/DksA family transcriptional regulator [Candidatus Doudnabacteria bacterium]
MTDKTKKIGKKKNSVPVFPASVLTPVSNFLTAKLHTLEKRKKEISKEDPFADSSRLDDNASPDAEADEQFGHARTSAINKELTKNIINVRKVLTRIRLGKYGICEECGQMIDTERLIAFPEATLCAKDAAKREE